MFTKLKFMPYANAKVEVTDEKTTLISYATRVAELTKDGWFTLNGLYSVTTLKHIKAFAREYLGAYFVDWCKKDYQRLINDNVKINIYTAEIIPIE